MNPDATPLTMSARRVLHVGGGPSALGLFALQASLLQASAQGVPVLREFLDLAPAKRVDDPDPWARELQQVRGFRSSSRSTRCNANPSPKSSATLKRRAKNKAARAARKRGRK